MGSPLCQECIPQGLGMAWPWGITVAWESFQKELPAGKNSQSCYTDCWESIASELNCQNLLTQSLSLFSCSFRLSKPLRSSAGSQHLKASFSRQDTVPLSLIRTYPAIRSKTTVALAAQPFPAHVKLGRRKPWAVQMSLFVTSKAWCSFPE